MTAKTARVEQDSAASEQPGAEDLGRLFLKTEGIKRFVVASPGNISVECKLNDHDPPDRRSKRMRAL